MKLGFIGENHIDGVEQDSWFAKENGFVGLEYNYWGEFADLAEDTVRRMREIHDRYGVKASMLGIWGWNHTSPDAAERELAHVMLDRAIGYAKILKADVLCMGGGMIPGASLNEQVAEFIKVFPPFIERILSAGMTPAFYAVHGNSFFESIESYEKVWEHLPQVTIKFDPANWMHHGDAYLPILRDYGNKIGHMHIKEHLYLDGDLASQPAAGMGDIEWGKVMAFLYEHNYQGHLSIEPHGPKWSQGKLRERMLLLTKKYMSNFML